MKRVNWQGARRSLAAWALGLAVIAGAPGTVPLAKAQDRSETALEHDRAGRKAFAQGDYLAAARAFEEACRVEPHAATRYNAALAWDQAQLFARAADAYEMALLEGGLDRDRESAARARLITLKPLLGTAVLEGPLGGTVSVEHVANKPLPTRIHLDPGPRSFRVRFPDGSEVVFSLRIRAGEITTLNPSPPAKPSPIRDSHQKPKGAPPISSRADDSGTERVWAWGAVSAAAAFSVAGVVLGLKTLKARDEFDASDHRDAAAHDRAVAYRTWTSITVGAAAACGVAGVVLAIRSRDKSASPAQGELKLGPTGVSALVRF